jgi:hypothetical protein
LGLHGTTAHADPTHDVAPLGLANHPPLASRSDTSKGQAIDIERSLFGQRIAQLQHRGGARQ